jgi:hypothetical protein
MLEKLKQIDKKFYIIMGAILGVLILIVVIVAVVRLLSGPGSNYSKLEKTLISAAESYLKDNPDEVPARGASITLDSATLITAGNLKELTKYVDDSCSATITVMNNGGSSLYLPDLVCSNYQTTQLSDKLIDDHLVVDSEDKYKGGLYEVGEEFIFKGKNVNNYISFGGLTWRIIKIDKNGNLRLIKNNVEKSKKQWDNKYNVDEKKYYGINDYKYSVLAEELSKSYLNVNKANKAHLIPHEVCVGKRAENNKTISYDVDCSETLEGQYISVINTLDFPMASLDENCTNVGAGACTNHNYLYSVISTTWTSIGSADNSYGVYNLSAGYSGPLNASKHISYNWIVYLSGQEIYTSGSGTEKDPYVIAQ